MDRHGYVVPVSRLPRVVPGHFRSPSEIRSAPLLTRYTFVCPVVPRQCRVHSRTARLSTPLPVRVPRICTECRPSKGGKGEGRTTSVRTAERLGGCVVRVWVETRKRGRHGRRTPRRDDRGQVNKLRAVVKGVVLPEGLGTGDKGLPRVDRGKARRHNPDPRRDGPSEGGDDRAGTGPEDRRRRPPICVGREPEGAVGSEGTCSRRTITRVHPRPSPCSP